MLSSALLSLGVAGSALAWPSIGHSRHSSIARAIHARQEPAVKAKEPVAATWFASWHADEFSLANVSWSKYTTVSYSFAVTTPNISFVNISDPEVFKDFVSTAHANNVSATISIGGWTGSLYFSSAVATAENRTEFVKTMVSLLEDNNLDGLSFDWEYPGASGVGCNIKSVNDTDNFLLFLKELRTALPSNATLSAATSITPFLSAEGTPSTNVSEFASVFDYIQLMNYDVWGPWSDTTGPNAPLNDTCATNATQKVGSAVSAIEAWTKAGFPADQLVLGVAGYGHGFSVESASALSDGILNAYSPFNKSFTPPGDAWDDAPVNGTVDVCGNPQAQGGTWNFWGLIEGGFLNENGTANTAEGIAYKYDECSQTPFVYNQTSGVMVAFDNAASFTAKGQFINSTGLRGFALWEAGGDFDDILLNAIRSGAGFPEVVEDYDDCDDDETGTTTPETGNASNNSGSNNSGNNSGSTSSNNSGSNNSASNNSGSSNSGSTSSNSGSTSTSNNSGSSSSNNSGSNSSSNSSNGSSSTTPSTSNNSGSNNSGNNGSGSSTTTPDYDDDEDDDCEDDDEPTTVTSAATSKPTATATSEDDDECEDDDEYSEPEATTIANPTTYQAPTAVPTATTPSTSAAQSVPTPEATLPDDEDDEDEECEDDETIIDATTSVSASGTASATSTVSVASTDAVSSTSAAPTATSSVASSEATVTSTASEGTYTSSAASATTTESAATLSSVSSESSTATETASTSQPTASADELIVSSSSASTESYEPSATSSNAEPTTSVRSSSSATSTSSEPATVTSSYEASESSESTTSARQTSSYESQANSEPTASTESSSSAAPTSTHPAPSTSAQPTSSEPEVAPAAPTSASSSSSSAVPTSAAPTPTFR